MDAILIALRIVHVGTGVFWAGTLLFVAIFLEPSVRAAGPGGAPVMQQLMRLRFFAIMPLIALLTLLSGFALYWKVSGGFDPVWLRSHAAMALGTGGVLATVAFIIGVVIMRPTTMRVFALSAAALQAPAEGRDAIMAQIAPLRARMKTTGRVVATLLGLATLAMAVARYI